MHIVLPITLVTAGVAALINIWLAVRVGRVRVSDKVLIGDGGNERLLARMRAHANFTENAPFALVLIAALELAAGSSIWLAAGAVLFVLGRLLHPFGMDGWLPARTIGIVLTWLATLALAIAAITLVVRGTPPVSETPVDAPRA